MPEALGEARATPPHLFARVSVRKFLGLRKSEVFAGVSDPLDLEAELLRRLEQRLKAHKQRRRAARFEDELVCVHEEAAFAQYIGVAAIIRHRRQDAAARSKENRIPLLASDRSQASCIADCDEKGNAV